MYCSKLIRCLFFLVVCANINMMAIAQAQEISLPELPLTGKTTERFTPSGWEEVATVKEDFDKDSLQDIAMILHKEYQHMIVILLQRKEGDFKRSFSGTFSSIEYITKLGKRNNTLQLVFDLPSYSAGHIINVYARYQKGEWSLIGYSEETYEDLESNTGNSSNPKGYFKDVNLLTGDVAEYNIINKKKTLKKKYKQQKESLLLKDIDKLSVMNW